MCGRYPGGVLRSARNAGLAALICAGGLVVTGLLALLFPIAQVRDQATLQGFTELDRPRLAPWLDQVAHLADPIPYALLGAACAVVALVRRRPRVALAVPVILVGAELTTQGLKQLLAQPRVADWLGEAQIADASWPSGHATAAMAIALCAVLVAPARWRPVVAAIGGLFAIAIAYAILALSWHFPSDIVGGYLSALTWTLSGVAVLCWWEERAPVTVRADPGPTRAERRLPLVVGGLVLAAALAVASVAPGRVADFAADHPTFMVGAGLIAVMAVVIALGFARALGTGVTTGSPPAATAVRPHRSPHG